ncbi:putative membrane protein [Spirosomataceae bacterium TFI 002]|nr:putative membrane protein [Spirosomataceae bacterium TFI 002]
MNTVIEYYLFFKALHIVGFVSWFAGLFYLVRIFVYHAETKDKPLEHRAYMQNEFSLMQSRAYKIIATPAMVITWTCGLVMLFSNPALLSQNWIRVKLVLLVILTGYHFFCRTIMKNQAAGIDKFTSFQFRLLNEFPTLFLVAIVLLAVVRDMLNFSYLFLGILAFGFLLFLAAKAYKKSRNK